MVNILEESTHLFFLLRSIPADHMGDAGVRDNIVWSA